MASTNQTTHYNLPVYSGSDIASWTDTNTPFADIDSAIYTASQTASSAASDVSNLTSTVSNHTTSISDINTDISALQLADTNMDTRVGTIETTVGGHTTSIATNASNISSNANAISDIEEDITDVESTNHASKAYAVGDTLIYDHDLYEVTAAISSGDTLTIGTNIVKTNVMEYRNVKTKTLLYTNPNPTDEQAAQDLITISNLLDYKELWVYTKNSSVYSSGYQLTVIPLVFPGNATLTATMMGILNIVSTGGDLVLVARQLTITPSTGLIHISRGCNVLDSSNYTTAVVIEYIYGVK